LAAAVEAPEPGFVPSAPGVSVDLAEDCPTSPGLAVEESQFDEPGLHSDPEAAPTLPPTDEPSWVDTPSPMEVSRGNQFGIEVTPGELVSGGVQDDGRAIVVPEIRTPYELPHLDLLDSHPRDVASFDEEVLRELAGTLEHKLADFGVKGEVVAIRPGPVITTFEYLPAPGIKVSKIAGLQDDIAMALKALRVRIVAPIPGKGVVGIEIPNTNRLTVWIRDMLGSSTFREHTGALPMALGKTVDGMPRVADLAKMPHLLVGGTTGSGKSVGVNAMLLSLLYTRTPEELRMILIDPKMLEFEMYRDIPHLLHPVVTDPKLASAALKWACTEMDNRYRILSKWKVRSIANYNTKLEQELEDWTPEKARKYAPSDWPAGQLPPPPKRMPYLVIVIDELADLMMVAAKDVEESIIRIAQKARAAGIHLIVATQRPSVNVITGLIKANMPSRIAFQVRTKIDGRTILDQNGAEALLGRGDMLFLPPGVSALERLHGGFVSDDEVNGVADFTRLQGAPVYEAEIKADDGSGRTIDEEEYDELYDEAVAFIIDSGKASSSMIQRRFKIGYNRAARIIEVMEQEGVIGAADGARPREVLVGRTA
jgi:S-DNA-T family DNA segregation ATPase FtsK/SpoIIIE